MSVVPQPAGECLLRSVGRERLAAYSSHQVSYNGLGHLQEAHDEVLKWAAYHGRDVPDQVKKALSVLDDLLAEKYAAALGITCEVCHNGARFYAENEQDIPRCFPSGNYVFPSGTDSEAVWGKNTSNVNWT